MPQLQQWQMWWPNWWKIWPTVHIDRSDKEEYGLTRMWVCIGPLQTYWWY